MRPIKLEMAGFGAYIDETVIDFDKLGNGLYLICGNTGAGKTTIFDALTFALFGRPSGENRTGEMLRSKYATLEQPTYVRLEFSNGGRLYTVKRNPSYERKALRGGGTTEQPAAAELTLPDGRVITGIEQVNSAIQNDILKLTHGQFTRIAMIAQGDFLKLLHAPTSERQDIFRKLFGTGRFALLTSELKELTSAEKAKKEKADDKIAAVVSGIDCDRQNELYESAALARQGGLTTEKTQSLVEQLIEHDKDTSDKLSKEAEEIEGQLKEISLSLEGEKKKGELLNKLTAERDKRDKLSAALEQRKTELTKAKGRLDEAQGLEKEAAAYEAQLSKYTELDELSKEHDKALAGLFSLKTKQDELNADKLSLSAGLEQMKKEAALYADTAVKEANTAASLEKAEAEKGKMSALSKRLSELLDISSQCKDKQRLCDGLDAKVKKLELEISGSERKAAELEKKAAELSGVQILLQQKENERENTLKASRELTQLCEDILTAEKSLTQHEAAARDYLKANEKSRRLKAAAEKLDDIFRCEQAGILALGLEENKPCPVCGSTSHPKPARLSENVSVPSEEEIKSARAAFEAAQAVADEALKKAQALKGKAAGLKNSALASAQRLLGKGCELGSAKALANERIQALDEKARLLDESINELNKKLSESEQLSRTIEAQKASLEAAKERLPKAQSNRNAASSELSTLTGRLDTLKEELNKELEAAFEQCSSTQAGEEIAKRTQELESELAGLHAELEALERDKKRSGELEGDIPKAERELLEKEKLLTDTAKDIAALNSKADELKKQRERLSAGLKLESLDKAQQHIAACKEKAQGIRQLYEKLREACSEDSNAVSLVEGSIKSLEAEAAGYPETDGKALLEKKAALDKALTDTRKRSQEAGSRIRVNKAILERLCDAADELKAAEYRYAVTKELYDTAAGNLAGHDRISLESYVQGAYFDNILARANRRLTVMQDGQYSLKRSTGQKGSGKTGLDLDVIDHTNDSVRSVKSLSGGESFVASLALALGLSEEIQASSGGIRLESMFIDEGFGSLDETVLSQAMKALYSISENDRSVGLISHVAELQHTAAIEHRIEVTKTQGGGSKAEVI